MCIIYLLLIVITLLLIFFFIYKYYDDINTLSKVHTHIYLSSYNLANNKDILRKNNIKNILTIMSNHNKMIQYKNIKYLQIDKRDAKHENLKDEFEKCFNFINNSVNNKENILIHCRMGKSRSPTIVASYLMKKYNICSNEALNYLRKHRSIIKPNSGFMKQLKNFENEIKGCRKTKI